jgi:hypothetical protein
VVPRESVDASAAVWTDASTSVSARVQAYGWKKSHVLFFRMGENLSKCRKRQTYNNWLAENKTANCTTWKVLEVVWKFFWDSRSVQNSPVYPTVQTHLPSVQVPPFMQMARQDLPSAPKDTVRPF